MVLNVVSLPPVYKQAGEQVEAFMVSIRSDGFNVRDKELVDRGYYEGLLDGGSFTSALFMAHQGRPQGLEWVATRSSNVIRETDDYFEYELRPSYEGTYKDAPFVTNSWGMRDQEYSQSKPPGI